MLPVTATDEYIVLIAEFGMRISDFAVIDRVLPDHPDKVDSFEPSIDVRAFFVCFAYFVVCFPAFPHSTKEKTTKHAKHTKANKTEFAR